MISNRQIDLNNLVTIDSTGLNVASFVDIKKALIDRYKEIYGKDIDLSTGNADGEFVNELSLMLNNLLQGLRTLYGNLDVNTASGVYLDSLCALSNIHRKQATRSTATVQILNNTGSQLTLSANDIIFSDQSGMTWFTENSIDLDLGEEAVLEISCTEFGPISAPAGWINILVGYPDIIVNQENAANIGENAESDARLRARRSQYTSPIGTTVLQSLSAALLDIQAIKDVKIYNNQSDNGTQQTTMVAKDTTIVNPHGIYVIIRQISNTIDVDDIIANTIYSKLTPGVQTTESSISAQSKNKTYTPTLLGLTIGGYTETVYWRLANPIHPNIVIKYEEINNSGYDPNTSELVSKAVFEYLNELSLGIAPDINEVVMAMLLADPRQKGISTIKINYSDIDLSNVQTNLDTYYNYTNWSDSNPDGPIHTITLS